MKEFEEAVRTEVANILGKEVEIIDVPKINGVKRAICIREGSMGANFYIEDFETLDAKEAAKAIARCFENAPRPSIDAENMDFSYENVKEKLMPRVVCIEKNDKLLENVIYKDMGCGLAVIPAVDMGDGFIFNISDALAENAGYDRFETIETAITNAMQRHPAKLSSLMSSIFGDGRNAFDSEDPQAELGDGLAVLTNDDGWMGASTMFYEGVLERVKDIVGEAFFVLPSSIHEVIIVPESMGKEVNGLKRMVLEANASVVEERDVLSDNVYYFNGELNKVA